jgi:hypothetical protein
MDQQTAAAIGVDYETELDPVFTGADSRVGAETESVKAARSAPEGPGLEGRVFGGYAGNGGAHGCFSGHAPLPRGEREEGLGGGTPSHIKAGLPGEIPAKGAQKEYSVNYAFRCLKTVDMYREGYRNALEILTWREAHYRPKVGTHTLGNSAACPRPALGS